MQRRQFLQSSALAGSLPTATLAPLRTTTAQSSAFNDDILINVFLRGGADGLHLLPPLDGPDRGHYQRYRPNLRVPTSGANAARPLAELDATLFGLHPGAAALQPLFEDGHLAILPAVGMPHSSRSHFDAMAFTELGTPGNLNTASGWLARHFASASRLPSTIRLPILALSATPPSSLLGNHATVTMLNPEHFSLGYSHWRWDSPDPELPAAQQPLDRDATLRRLYRDDDLFSLAGAQALNAETIIAEHDFSQYPRQYPDSDFGQRLRAIAQVIRLDVGLRIATIDLGGWDTHAGQDDGNFFHQQLAEPLAHGLAAFFDDMDAGGYSRRLTIVVQSEFGRRVYENADRGTDHGSAGIMLVLGRTVNGGRLYGRWPGLADEQLYAGEDLAHTIDYRQVFSEILQKRLDNRALATVFPGFSPGQSLGLIRERDDLPVQQKATLFGNSFE